MPTRMHKRSAIVRPRLERDIKKSIKDMLDKLGIDSWRMQAGGYRGRTRGLPAGTPDILAAPIMEIDYALRPTFLWIETKTKDNKPTKEQLEFADDKRKKGHHWIIARCEDDVLNWIKENRAC